MIAQLNLAKYEVVTPYIDVLVNLMFFAVFFFANLVPSQDLRGSICSSVWSAMIGNKEDYILAGFREDPPRQPLKVSKSVAYSASIIIIIAVVIAGCVLFASEIQKVITLQTLSIASTPLEGEEWFE